LGVARCIISDSNNTDSVLTPVVINDGVAIELGRRGAKIKFSGVGIVNFAVGDSWTVNCQHSYFTNVRKVYEAELVPQTITTFPALVYAPGRIPYDLQGSSSNYRCDMTLHIELWVSKHESVSVRSALLFALKDIENLIASDPMCGGYANDVILTDSDFYLPVQGSPFAAVSVEISIWYNNIIN
jgi:hypothetical protein